MLVTDLAYTFSKTKWGDGSINKTSPEKEISINPVEGIFSTWQSHGSQRTKSAPNEKSDDSSIINSESSRSGAGTILTSTRPVVGRLGEILQPGC